MDPSFPNPYQAPISGEPLEAEGRAPGENATRGSRLAAAIIDSFIGLALIFPVQLWAGVYEGFPAIKPQPFPQSLFWMVGGVAVWIAVHGWFLAHSAQTIGKKLMGIQIVMIDSGRPAPFERLVLWRYLPLAAIAQIPMLGALLSLVDVLFIFREDRRCVHDHIARTRVVVLDRT